MGVYSNTTANAYADKIKAVYEHLGEIRKVADRLTPVEDLTSFQVQISALYDRLDVLVEASNLIVTATPVGESILVGSVPSIRMLLGITGVPAEYVTESELAAALAGHVGSGSGGNLSLLIDGISAINLQLTELDQYRQIQQSTISGLQTNYQNVAAGLETNQLNTETALQRLTVQEQFATLVDAHLNSIDQSLVSTITGLQAANSVLAGHTADIQSTQNSIIIHSASIDSLASSLVNANTGITANTTALNLMETSITQLGNSINAGSQQTLALKSVIGGSGNLLPNADFSVGASGWQVVVAEEDWASSVLETNAFNTPPDVNCLSVLGTPTPLGQIVIQSPLVLVAGSGHYIVSGYPCVDNGTVSLSYKAFDALGAMVGQGECPATFNVTTNPNFNSYTRTWVKFLTSVNAVKLRLYLTATGDGDWLVQAGLFRPMIERAWLEQAGPSEWTPNVSGIPELLAEAVQTLSTEVSNTQSGVAANTTAITALTATVAGKASASALSELSTRVTNTETTNTSQATAISNLQVSVGSLPTVYLQASMPSGSSFALGSIWLDSDDSNKQYVWNGTIWSAGATISGITTFVQASAPTATANGDLWYDSDDGYRPYRWNGAAWVDLTDTRLTAAGSAISTLQTRATNIENNLSVVSSNVTTLTGRVDTADGVAAAQGTALTSLTTRVSNAEGVNTSQSTSIIDLTSAASSAQTTANTAITAAATAQTTANTANGVLADIASDALLTPGEKPAVILERDVIVAEKTGIETQATTYGINTEKTAYTNAVNALTAYLATLTTPVLWSNLGGNTTIVGATFRTKFSDVYAARQVLLNRIVTVVDTTAQSAAAAAAASAMTANNALADIASDSLLTPGEKPVVIANRDTLVAEQFGIDAQATAYGIGAEKTNYDNAVAALVSYLATLTAPVLWSNLAGNTTIVGATFRSKFADVYATRQALLNKILAVSKTMTDSNASATQTLSTRVDSVEGVNTAQATSITSLNTAIAGKADVSAVTALTTRVSDMQGAGQNMLSNSTFQANGLGWLGYGTVSGYIVRDMHGFSYQPPGMHALVLAPDSAGTVGYDYYYAHQDISCEPGKEYIISAYMAAHRAKCFVFLLWYDQTGAVITGIGTPDTLVGSTGVDLAANYSRLFLKATAPAGAKKVAVCYGYRKTYTGIGGDIPFVWIIRPMFEEVPSAQTTPSRWNSGGAEMFAGYSLALDVNGYVSGYQSNNDGTTANFAILANNFSVNIPGGGPGLAWNNGILWNRGAGYSVLIGQDMSPTSDLIFWIGPTPASAANATKAAASMWVDELGNASFSGKVYQSIISASAIELGSTRIHTGGGRLAPFTIKGAAYKGTGVKFAGTCELASFVSPNVGTGYDSKRCSRLITDVNLRCDMRGNGTSGDKDILYLEVQYDGGSWVTIISKADISVDNNGGWMMLIRYTSEAAWSSMKFRARTVGGRTVVLGIEAEIDNTYETSNATGSFSGIDSSTGTGGTATGTSGGGTGGTGGAGGIGDPEPFCVVADMTYLPDGLLVADHDVQNDFPCWNGNIENPGIEMHPLQAMPIGFEACYIVVAENGCSVPQSVSTPIPLRDGRLVRTVEALGHEVLTNIDGVLAWSTVVSLVPLGMRRVVKPDLGNRVFFAGINPRMTIATHNIVQK